jgi:hypothetical protein
MEKVEIVRMTPCCAMLTSLKPESMSGIRSGAGICKEGLGIIHQYDHQAKIVDRWQMQITVPLVPTSRYPRDKLRA